MCRGLITDTDGNIVARPYKKFFNYQENKHIATDFFKVFDKADGSLGIVFYYAGEWRIATRGSFHSDQAIKGKELLSKYEVFGMQPLDTDYTYLFEIIYKQNRIVVDYLDYEGLILHGKINTDTGEEESVQKYSVSYDIIKTYDFDDYKSLLELDWTNHEGFIVLFSNGHRCKIKLKEYVRLHGVITNTSNRTVWEILSNDTDISELINSVPDEFYNWVKKTIKDMEDEYLRIELKTINNYNSILKVLPKDHTKKDFALYIKDNNFEYPGLLFNLLNGKDNKDNIWKILYPKNYEKAFSI
jgi:RNA ligase